MRPIIVFDANQLFRIQSFCFGFVSFHIEVCECMGFLGEGGHKAGGSYCLVVSLPVSLIHHYKAVPLGNRPHGIVRSKTKMVQHASPISPIRVRIPGPACTKG